METTQTKPMTADEKKQRYIIMQSQSKLANEFLSCKTNCKHSLNELAKTTELLTDLVINGYNEVKPRLEAFDKYIDKKYNKVPVGKIYLADSAHGTMIVYENDEERRPTKEEIAEYNRIIK